LTLAGHDLPVDPVELVVDPVEEVVDPVELVVPWWPYQPCADAGATVAVSDTATIASVATNAVTPPRYRCRLPWLLSIIRPPSCRTLLTTPSVDPVCDPPER
jgi:hypothetical protein